MKDNLNPTKKEINKSRRWELLGIKRRKKNWEIKENEGKNGSYNGNRN